LTKRYGDRLVLDHLDFEVRRGECLVVLGRSGSGKSVTLRQLDGLEAPDEGSIVFDGTDIAQLPEKELYPLRHRVAMLFQGGAIFDSTNVFDNVAFPLRERSQRAKKGRAQEFKNSEEEIAAKVQEKLGLVHLSGIEKKMPADLSGGMKKRVALARSLALDP